MTRERRFGVLVVGAFKLVNDGKINDFRMIIGSKQKKEEKNKIRQQRRLELKETNKSVAFA